MTKHRKSNMKVHQSKSWKETSDNTAGQQRMPDETRKPEEARNPATGRNIGGRDSNPKSNPNSDRSRPNTPAANPDTGKHQVDTVDHDQSTDVSDELDNPVNAEQECEDRCDEGEEDHDRHEGRGEESGH